MLPSVIVDRFSLWCVAIALMMGLCLAHPGRSAGAPVLPDLVADPPVGGNAPVVYGDAQGSRLLLRMDGFVHNRGPGALEIRGSDPLAGSMRTVSQRVYDDAGAFTDRASAADLLYETNDDHAHWHLRNAMRYSLWSADRSAEVAPSQKVGFCLEDSEPIEAPAAATATYTEDAGQFCRSGEPEAASVFMGVSAGWRDIYSYVLAFQWIDISEAAPGRYWLRADADPDNVIAETDEVNPGVYDAEVSVVNGHLAEPVSAGKVPADETTAIALEATTYDDVHLGSPGPREFQIVTAPTGGTLDQPVGTWFAASSVRYTPNPGFDGADTFTVAARDASSPFPRTPPAAAVTLTVAGGPPQPGKLGISGAPRSVRTSSSTKLTATGPGVRKGVRWRVDAGTINANGLFRAPARPGRVTVTALSGTGARGSVAIRIRRARKPRPAPTIKPPPVPDRGLSEIRLQLHEGRLLAAVTSARSGRVHFNASSRGRRFGSCSMAIRRGGSATCRLRAPRPSARSAFLCRISRRFEATPTSKLVVRARLARHGRTVARRRAALGGPNLGTPNS